MSFFKVDPDDIQSFTVVTNPVRYFTTSSLGATGSVYVFPRRSDIEKEMAPLPSFIEATHNDNDLESELRTLQNVGMLARGGFASLQQAIDAEESFPNMIQTYMGRVTDQGTSARKQKLLNIIRFTPSVSFTSNTLRKLIVKDQLSDYYRTSYPSAHWAYSNYNSLNFFTSSTVPTSSCLLYPNIAGGPEQEGYASGTYVPSGAFSFDFYINPRHRPDQVDGEFKAGTIYHLSSTFAVSLVTGSAKDKNGLPLGFRILLQLSHSADVLPSEATPGDYPNDLIFLSDDNSLSWNNWHHVVVRWGSNQINEGTGSFNIDKVDRGKFVIPSSTIAPRPFPAGGPSGPDVLVIGNYFNGTNQGIGSLSYFFAADPAERDGLQQLIGVTSVNEPEVTQYEFDHPLNAELHDVSIKRYYMTDADIDASASMGPNYIDPGWVSFYLPPFFIEDSPFRKFVGDVGGIFQTPFFEVDGTTNDPFNVAMSFGVNGHYINIENFLKDFANNVYPRVHHMSGVAIMTTTEAREANEFLYEQPFVVRRNTLIMPCDDGLFIPAFELLASESNRASAVDDLDSEELSYVHLDELLLTSSLLFYNDFNEDTSFADEQIGFTPEQPGLPAGNAYQNYVNNIDALVSSGNFDPGVQMGAPLTIYQRTRDPSSNQVTFFDISNLYYGLRILPGSFELYDPALSGSGGAFGIRLKDDGRGTIYRADCFTSASTWSSVGTIFYDEGIVVIKSPHLYFYGKEGYEMSFRGEQNVHVLTIDTVAGANQLNSSSNPNYVNVPPSAYPNDPDKEFVYITGMNFHDENLNVIMKTQLAQPIMKRNSDKILLRVKMDY